MHIKQVIIEGFKSYKEQTATDHFSPGHNAVVGANGAGKSNFFQAIRFVLSDLFHSMPAEERRTLLHEGAGTQVMSAYVEVVFDNEDNRIPVDREEVRLRRSIGLKKDEYFLDGKHTTKAEVINLLESAGFSRSNPYYIVQQGKIMAIATQKDKERLELLKEIGGTSVYEDRRAESLKSLHETEAKRAQIREVETYIEEKLSELDGEREELERYNALDTQRRGIEYTLYDQDLEATRAKLEDLEQRRREVTGKNNDVHERISDAGERRKEIEAETSSLEASLAEAGTRRGELKRQKTEAARAKAKAELDVKELEEQLAADGGSNQQAREQLATVEGEILQAETELSACKEQLAAERGAEDTAGRAVAETERALSILYQKQGRSTQFKSKAERDAWLDKEIAKTRDTTGKRREQARVLRGEIAELEASCADRAAEVGEAEAAVAERERLVEACTSETAELRSRRDTLNNTRRELWRRDSQLDEELKQLQRDITAKEKNLEYAVARDINRGLLAVKRICQDHKIGGVHGALIELLDCDERFFTAVEVTAGNSLFHVVVEDDEVATKIIRFLNKEKGGRVSFMPLNRMSNEAVQYPSSKEAVPLVSKLKFNSRYKAAVQQVFGKTLICRDLDVATGMSRDSNLNCVTMDGDQVNKKGALSGGFTDQKRSRLGAMKAIKELTKKCEVLRTESASTKTKLQELDQEVSKVLGELEKKEAKRNHLREQAREIGSDLAQVQEELSAARASLEQRQRSVASIDESVETLEKTVEDLTAEKKQEMLAQLTAAEQAELHRLVPLLRTQKDEAAAARERRTDTEARCEALEAKMKDNLERQRKRLKKAVVEIDVSATSETLDTRKVELVAAAEALDDILSRLGDADKQVDGLKKQIDALRSEDEKLRSLSDSETRRLQDEAKELESLMSKRQTLEQKQEDCLKKIRELGAVSLQVYEQYKGKRQAELHKALSKTNSELKKFSHINQKALDQFMTFSKEREDLTKRASELNAAHAKIEELINVLDQRKDECIERTFKQVAINFRTVFSELVHNGTGNLVMQKKRMAVDDDPENEDGNAEGKGAIEKYQGVKIKVSFGAGDTLFMEQLSGGQKTVVALAMIFAIQRCDPAAFYLFDEIDAALDNNYRQAVADMVKSQAATGVQYITTTFRPELVKVADYCFGVSHVNRVSKIQQVAREDALKFIAHTGSEPPRE